MLTLLQLPLSVQASLTAPPLKSGETLPEGTQWRYSEVCLLIDFLKYMAYNDVCPPSPMWATDPMGTVII